jgi:hypothetical protein
MTALLLACATAFAADPKPSDDSIKQLFEVMNARKLVDDSVAQVDGYLKSMMEQSLKGKTLTAEEQRLLQKYEVELGRIAKEELTWERYEPIMTRVYQKSFTQEEIDGLVAFYRTPVGKALRDKMPLVMRNVMAEIQPIMNRLMEKFEKMATEVEAKEGR